MAEGPPAEAAGHIPALDFQAGYGPFHISIKIDNPWLAAGIVGAGILTLGAFYNSHRESVEAAVRVALADLPGRVLNITQSSILVRYVCDTEEKFLAFMKAFATGTVKQRLREELSKIGFKYKLEVTITVYDPAPMVRLNITPPASPVFGASVKSGRLSAKRKCLEGETLGTKYSNKGYIQIKEASADGTFVKLFNSGAKDFRLGGWSVERSVDGEPPVIYKFTPNYVLKTGSFVTIWASQGGGQHKSPTDLIFRQQASWGVGKETMTVLKDSDGQEAATVIGGVVGYLRSEETDSRKMMSPKRKEAATVIGGEVGYLRTKETDSPKIMSPKRKEAATVIGGVVGYLRSKETDSRKMMSPKRKKGATELSEQEPATAISKVLDYLGTVETDSRVRMSGQRKEAATVIGGEVGYLRTKETDSPKIMSPERKKGATELSEQEPATAISKVLDYLGTVETDSRVRMSGQRKRETPRACIIQ